MTLMIEIDDDDAQALTAKATAQGISAQQYARQILHRDLEHSSPRPPLSARIRELWSDMPDEVRAKLPTDGASQADHYVYGLPKRGQ